jgi:hypothetical protein
MRAATSRILFGAWLIATALSAQDGPRGHWTGIIDVPGHALAVEIDLDKSATGWIGSMAIPAQHASGLPLEAIAFTNGQWTFRIKGGPDLPVFAGTLSADGSTLSGDFTQKGESFPFKLSRIGDAHVEQIKRSPAVAAEFLGTWEGTLTKDGRTQRLVLKLANDEGGASAVLISPDEGIEIPVAAIEQKEGELKLSVQALGGEYWGELNPDGTQLSGSWTQSGNNFQLKFKKKGAGGSKTEALAKSPGPPAVEGLQPSPALPQELSIPSGQQEQEQPKQELAPPLKPLSVEQEQIIAKARVIALDYTRRLPDFICQQLTRRYVDPQGENGFQLRDTVTAQLTYFGQKEDYKLISRKANYKLAPKAGNSADSSFTHLDGATSSGEFGTLLRQLFEPATQAEFWFQHRASLLRQPVLVFGYRVPAASSRLKIEYNPGAKVYTPAYTGSLFIDPETHEVLRVTMQAERMPASFPIQAATTQLDFARQDLAGQEYLLPVSAVVEMREGRRIIRNDIEFRNYRKYSAASAITFDADSAAATQDEQQKDKQPSSPPRP